MSRKQSDVEAGLDEVITVLQEKLLVSDPTSDEFAKMVDQLDKLHKIKSHNKDDRVTLATLLPVIGNLAGILAILNFEKAGVITSKALGFVTKTRA